MVAFGLLLHKFGRRWGPTNGTLRFYESRLSVGDTQWW